MSVKNSDKQLTGSSFRNGLRENESRSYISNYQNMRIYSINIHTSVGSEQINLDILHRPVSKVFWRLRKNNFDWSTWRRSAFVLDAVLIHVSIFSGVTIMEQLVERIYPARLCIHSE